jgi:penicillin-binding protein 2
MRRLQKQHIKSSIRVLQVSMIGLFFVLIGRLYQLQILDYQKYNPLSKKNSIRREYVSPARGLIYDRNGNLLVDNEPIYTITITPAKYDTNNNALLARLLNVKTSDLRGKIAEAENYSWHRKSRLYTEVDFGIFSRIQENIWRLPGIGHLIESKRHYPTPAKAAHILGYLREVSQKTYLDSDHYQLGDKVGKSGLEQIYEKYLRGKQGTSYKLVNAFGQELGPYDNGTLDKAPLQGSDLYTTLDTDLQIFAEKLMKNKRGSIVALNPQNGAILAMVSSPEYKLSKLAGRLDHKYWAKINADTTSPLFNRAIAAQEPPGSTIKPLMALIGLHLGIITPKTIINNPGYFYLGRRYGDHAEPGKYDLVKAIAHSSNTYFFTVMYKIARDGLFNQWHDLASDFGLGHLDYVDLPGERKGILPDSSYFNNRFGVRKWSIGDIINLGIGQGVMSATPLQMALVSAEIANNGYKVQPHIVRAIKKSDGTFLSTDPVKKKISWVTQKDIDVVKKGMREVAVEGTARWYANVKNIKIAGKTGTAQNPRGRDDAWFISFAPYKNPKIALAVLVENAGYGSQSAVPISTLMIEKYLTGKIQRKWLLKKMINFNPADTTGTDE